MQLLPALAVGSTRWALPVADASAAALVQSLLVNEAPEAHRLLADAIARDPSLALWSVVRATETDAAPCDIDQLAAWFTAHALPMLRWDADAVNSHRSDGDEQSAAWADRAAEAVRLAELGALLARSDHPEIVGPVYLAGLLHAARRWLTLEDRGKAAELRLPDVFATIAPWVDRASAVLDEGRALDVADGVLARCQQRADEVRRYWLQPAPLGAILPELVERLARLERLETRFDETLEAEKLEAMAEFAAGAGHEINNPLAVIAGRAQLLLQDEEDMERRRGLALMNAQAKRVYEMIADMMLFARPPAPAFAPIDVVALVDRVIGELASQAEQQATPLSRSGENVPLEIDADATQLGVALHAVCRNALEAVAQEGYVEISVAEAGDRVEIRVADDGPGVSAAVRRHLFDPYYSARQAGRGLGLGLAKCWRIVVTNHQGRVDVDSQPDLATVVTITLPKRQGRMR